MSKLSLSSNPTLSDFQQYVNDMVKERNFAHESVSDVFLLMTEEVGELAKAIRRRNKIAVDEASKEKELEGELADIFIYLLDICNHFDVDLEQAFRDKEEVNKRRTWKPTA